MDRKDNWSRNTRYEILDLYNRLEHTEDDENIDFVPSVLIGNKPSTVVSADDWLHVMSRFVEELDERTALFGHLNNTRTESKVLITPNSEQHQGNERYRLQICTRHGGHEQCTVNRIEIAGIIDKATVELRPLDRAFTEYELFRDSSGANLTQLNRIRQSSNDHKSRSLDLVVKYILSTADTRLWSATPDGKIVFELIDDTYLDLSLHGDRINPSDSIQTCSSELITITISDAQNLTSGDVVRTFKLPILGSANRLANLLGLPEKKREIKAVDGNSLLLQEDDGAVYEQDTAAWLRVLDGHEDRGQRVIICEDVERQSLLKIAREELSESDAKYIADAPFAAVDWVYAVK